MSDGRGGMRSLGIALAAVLSFACSDGGGEAPPAQEGAAEAPAGIEAEIPAEELGDIDPENVTLALRWTTRPIYGEVQTDASPARTVSEVRYDRAGPVDRMTVEFVERGTIPSYEIQSSIRPFPYCERADSVRSQGPGLLRVRLPQVSVDSAAARPPAEGAGLGNVTSVHLSCLRDREVEWVLDVRDATAYRTLHLSNPTRLVVDVRHAVPAPAASSDTDPSRPGADPS